jgi:hypothetical protein
MCEYGTDNCTCPDCPDTCSDEYSQIQVKERDYAAGILAKKCRDKDKEIADLRSCLQAAEAREGALREALEKLPQELRKKVSDPNLYDYEELTFPPEWANDEQREELEDWLSRFLERAGQLAGGTAEDSIPDTPPPARWEDMINALKLCREELRYAPCRDNPERTLCLKCKAEKVADDALATLQGGGINE